MEAIWHAKLQCGVYSIHYSWSRRSGQIFCAGCTDMPACIKLFKSIDPRIKEIVCYDEGRMDIIYRKDKDNWIPKRVVSR